MIRFVAKSRCGILQVMSKSETMFYAVKKGRIPGVYSTWSECEKQVKGFCNPSFRKFSTHEAALEFITGNGGITASQPSSQQSSGESSHAPFRHPAAASSSHASAVDISLVSLHSAVENMKTQLENIVGVVGNLSMGLAEVTASVSRLEKTFFQASGSKRSFSTSTMKKENEEPAKRPKFDYDAEYFTGKKFEQGEGTPVYTDGGCFDNGRNGARAGIGVYWAKDDPDNISERLPGRPTNNRAEIHAAVRAVQVAKKKRIQNLILHTDSQFLINGITKWIRGWKKNQWKKTTGSPVINKDDFEVLDRELKGINVKWVYVRGHAGDPANEEADHLAKQGAEKLEPDSMTV